MKSKTKIRTEAIFTLYKDNLTFFSGTTDEH